LAPGLQADSTPEKLQERCCEVRWRFWRNTGAGNLEAIILKGVNVVVSKSFQKALGTR